MYSHQLKNQSLPFTPNTCISKPEGRGGGGRERGQRKRHRLLPLRGCGVNFSGAWFPELL